MKEVKATPSTDKVMEAVKKAKNDWEEAFERTLVHIRSIEQYGSKFAPDVKKESLPRLNELAQDGLTQLTSLHFNLDLLSPQLPTDDEIQAAQLLLQSWSSQIHRRLKEVGAHSWLLKNQQEF